MWPPWPDCTTDGANRDEVEGEKRSIITAKLFEGAVATRGAVNAYEGRKRRTQRLERWRGPRKASKTPTEVTVNDDTEDLIRLHVSSAKLNRLSNSAGLNALEH